MRGCLQPLSVSSERVHSWQWSVLLISGEGSQLVDEESSSLINVESLPSWRLSLSSAQARPDSSYGNEQNSSLPSRPSPLPAISSLLM